ncbi:hypothetical protein PISMIDRAFT_6424 [Pisolithus microcarpus 441]|uniref:Uncharacterized protein n=1 Tax=Pisolithus microcarpus 441 TaxID=765257 RepID=A0A0D0AE07_9AGAM|nr:hypothetical protein PISMIDRAFT_6424 [Pisolithus microcarpus 441]
MDERPLGQRKLSRRSSKNTGGGKSSWHRPSFKKSTEGATATRNHSSALNADSTQFLVNMDSDGVNDAGKSSQDDNDDQLPSLLSHSVVPDPLGELPAWFKKENDMAAANVSTFRIKYPLHNPQGPPWYKNHHLIPPSALNPPPLFFSPSFPPMAASIHDRSEDSTRPPGPSRSPSGTPLPTPSSSQVRIPEIGGKPRSRKTSQDNVDLMDLSDPWGTHWHHESPYDAGTNTSPVSVDQPESTTQSRSRLSSLNAGQPRHKTVNPSPLSQSTSAVHLHVQEPPVTRKLSKRRKPGLAGLFGPQDKGVPQDEVTSVTSPNTSSAANRSSLVPSSLHLSTGAARRHSTLSPMSVPLNASSVALSTHSANKKEKRGSVLGRLVRRFSVLRRGTQDIGATISESVENEKRGSAPSAGEEGAPRRSLYSQRPPSPEKRQFDPSKRVPPPKIDSDLLTQAENGGGVSSELQREINDHRSSLSGDVPFSPLGKLTITNPDLPSSGGTTPVGATPSLPPEHLWESLFDSQTRNNGRHLEILQTNPDDPSKVGDRLSVISPPATGRLSPAKGLLSPLTVPPPSPSPPAVDPTSSSAHFVTRKESPSPNKEPSFVPTLSTSASASASVPGPSKPSPEPTRPLRPHLTLPHVDDSPLSRASVLVNPPTPCNAEESRARLPTPNKQFKGPHPEEVSSRDPSPTKSAVEAAPLTKSNSTTSRQTETFRLVRSPSEKKSLSESIIAEGEQWLLVNAEDALRRRRTKDREEKSTKAERTEKVSSRSRDRESRRSQGKHDKAETSDSRQRAASHAKVKSSPANQGDNNHMSVRPSRALSLDGAQRPLLIQPMVFTLQDEPPRVRKGDDRRRDSSHSKPARAGPSSIVAVARVERVPSGSTRPTSELTSTADINSLKAREAWNMDRLWKGRSMYHGQPEAPFIHTPPPPSVSRKEFKPAKVEPVHQDVVPSHGAAHGSSHTSYVVQPLQAHPVPASVFYANMPSAPPPIIYATTSPYGQVPHRPRDYKTFRSLPEFSFPPQDTSDSPNRTPNPLPAPPRESSYQPAPFPALPGQSSGSASEYWTKHTSVPLH